MVCSICGGNHKRNNKKYHTKEEIEIHDILMDIVKKVEQEDKLEKKDKKDKGNKEKKTRKNTDYQFTELLVCLILLGLVFFEGISLDFIIKFSMKKEEEKKLQCNRNILGRYHMDLKDAFKNNKFKTSYILNFDKNILNIDLSDIKYVYLTGKSYKDFPKIVEINKGYEDKKPNSDVYFELNNGEINGISCKQSFSCPCTNKVVELNNEKLMESRHKTLNDNGITKENFKNHRDKKSGGDGKIGQVLKNNFCITGYLQDYWSSLQLHILNNKNYFIDQVLNSMNQGIILPYQVYEYDGKELVNTKNRKLEKNLCDIKISNTFCYGKTKPREASKIWFDFIYNEEIKYNLEVRFKGIYFGPGGQPQIFILKESKENIILYQKTRDKYQDSKTL
tara:strand:- start:823 stop:1998 length:1176 start_codon:yes stop_codon:yes gene_type:complete